MSGPWEDYKPAAAEAGPWADFKPAAAPSATPAPAVTAPGYSPASAGARQGLTFNFGDEIMAGLTTPIEMAIGAWKGTDEGKGIGQRIGDAYSRSLEQERALTKRAEAESPVAYGLGNVAGGMVTAGQMLKGGATLMKGTGSIPKMAAQAAAEGAAYGALSGAGEGEGWEGRRDRAIRGGAIGAAAGGALGTVAGALAARNGRAAAPAIDELTALKDAAYKRADDAGVAFTPEAAARLKERVTAALTNIGFDPALQPGAKPALDRILALEGQNTPLTGLDTIRKVASNGYIPGNKSNNKAISQIIESIDDIVTNPRATEVLMGDAQTAGEALKEARALASRIAKSETVARAVNSAELRAASTGSGGNADNATRQNIRRILEKPRGFTAEERAALEQIVRGTKTQNAARLVGKLAPSGNGLALGGNLLAAGQTAGASLPFTAAGMGAKAFADGATARNVAVADALIRSGGSIPAPALTDAQRAIAQILNAQLGQRGQSLVRGQ